MSSVLLPTRGVEIEKSFMAWETSFHVRPCMGRDSGIDCGHDATVRAHGKCTGCELEEDSVFLCEFHLATYRAGRMVFHVFPCGYAGMRLSLSNIERV